MDTVLKLKEGRSFWSFSRKLFFSVISLFLLFSGSFITYQYQREKEYKVELLDLRLQDYNQWLHDNLQDLPDTLWQTELNAYIHRYAIQGLRITVMDVEGNILYDSSFGNKLGMNNHLLRPEIQRAIKTGKGHDVRRISETTGDTYFYSATTYPDCIIRSALPYNIDLIENLAVDHHYIWATCLVSLLLIIMFYTLTAKLGHAINNLRTFAKRADKNEPIETEFTFPHDELGEISQHIIQIYRRLRKTKEELYIEREKLITHLQTSHEGLGIFTRDKKEILVNNLFTQYANLLSDTNLQNIEEIFTIKELQRITDFINQSQHQPIAKGEKRLTINITKNGYVFDIKCIIFQDFSFEISINDITQEEEQIRLKRQLTQNIAHELKTPVSSIQGYLETIVNNPTLSPDQMQLFLKRCYAQSNRLTFLLRDISVLTRMDEATNMIDMEYIDLNQLINSILNEVAPEVERKHITVVNHLPSPMPLYGNYSLLYSIFRNLMDNSLAYAGTDIHIHISCFREDEHFYYFSFADNGIGVASEHLSRLFERFYRVDKGRSRKLGGTGLGLAIVKNAVLIHGGTISAKNNSERGLEFVFTLRKGKG